MDTADEVQSDQEDGGSIASGRESRSSSLQVSGAENGSPEHGPMSPDDESASPRNYQPSSPINGPESPENEPPSPEQEPISPVSLGPRSPDNEESQEEPASPNGSMDDGEAQEDKRSQSDEEVVREDADSGDEARGSDNEDKASQADNNDDEVERGSVISEGAESPRSNQGGLENDDGISVHSEIEERASIHSDDENEKSDDDSKNKDADDLNDSKSGMNDADSNSDDDSDDDSKVGELIADIFGESDEDGEFEGFGEEDLADTHKKKDKKKSKVLSDSESEDEKDANQSELIESEGIKESEEKEDDAPTSVTPPPNSEKKKDSDSDSDGEFERDNRSHMVYDFDLMMMKKKEENGKRKRKRGYEIINDSDDLIADILAQMKQAADDDRNLNKNRVAATKKLKLLPLVASQLMKSDLKEAFLDQGVLSVMTDWLTPLPDRSLPHLQIRDTMLKLLREFPPVDQILLKNSGIGRAVMYLYKHPKETRENRDRAGRLINEWSRPIFNLNTNFRSMTKEERERRDFDHMPKKRKERLEAGDETGNDINSALTTDDKTLRPGEKGWVGRARVPMPSTRDYVVRPKWNVETEFTKSSRKQLSRLDKHVRNFIEKKKRTKAMQAVTISIEGRKMSL